MAGVRFCLFDDLVSWRLGSLMSSFVIISFASFGVGSSLVPFHFSLIGVFSSLDIGLLMFPLVVWPSFPSLRGLGAVHGA